jgi:hypothetical protein
LEGLVKKDEKPSEPAKASAKKDSEK